MTNIEDLRARLKRVDDLLADPHPRLSSWQHLYHLSVIELLEFWEDKPKFRDPISEPRQAGEFEQAVISLLTSYSTRIHQLTALHKFPMEVEDWERDYSLATLKEAMKGKL